GWLSPPPLRAPHGCRRQPRWPRPAPGSGRSPRPGLARPPSRSPPCRPESPPGCGPCRRGARSLARRHAGLGKAGTGIESGKPKRWTLAPPVLVEQKVLDELADQMDDQDVHLLNSLGVGGWDDKAPVGKLAKGAAVPAEECQGVDAEAGGSAERPDQVLRAPAGADPHEEVIGAGEGLDLTLEDRLVPGVVRPAGQHRAVGGERERRQRRPVRELESPDELADEMLRVGGTAAVAAHQHLAPTRQAACEGMP